MRVEGNYLKYLNSGCNRKEQRRNKDFKIGGQAGSRGGCLKRGGGWLEPPCKLCICIYAYSMYVYMYMCIIFISYIYIYVYL